MKLRARFPHASQSFLDLNLGAGADFPADHSQPQGEQRAEGKADHQNDVGGAIMERSAGDGALGAGQPEGRYPERFLVRVTSIRRVLLDEDNLCEKFVVDCCRYAGLLSSDDPSKTKIEVTQRKAEQGEGEYTIVEIFSLPVTPQP